MFSSLPEDASWRLNQLVYEAGVGVDRCDTHIDADPIRSPHRMAFMNGWLPSLLLLLSVDAYVQPSTDLALGITTVSLAHELGHLQLQLSGEAEWDLEDATLVPIDVAVVSSAAPLSWLSVYGGVATNVTIERLVSGSTAPQTTTVLSAALRAGASIEITERFAVALDVECSIPVSSESSPEMLVEFGPSFSF